MLAIWEQVKKSYSASGVEAVLHGNAKLAITEKKKPEKHVYKKVMLNKDFSQKLLGISKGYSETQFLLCAKMEPVGSVLITKIMKNCNCHDYDYKFCLQKKRIWKGLVIINSGLCKSFIEAPLILF